MPKLLFSKTTVGLLLSLAALAQLPAATESAPDKFEPPKSVFQISPTGKDPFYPSIPIAGQKIPASTNLTNTSGTNRTPVGPIVAPPTASSLVKLEGINYTGTGGTAIINGQRFKPGQRAKVYAAAPGPAKGGDRYIELDIRCLEITKECVKLMVSNEPEAKTICLR
jgi:hypothetical protein